MFSAHGVGQDTILRNLALLNVLCDGGEIALDRRSKPSFALLERAGMLPRAALAILAERGRARMEEDGRRRAVAINPALLADRLSDRE